MENLVTYNQNFFIWFAIYVLNCQTLYTILTLDAHLIISPAIDYKANIVEVLVISLFQNYMERI